MRPSSFGRAAAMLGLLGASASAIDVDYSSGESVRSAASTIAYGLMKYYTGNYTGDTPGNLPDPYFWWEAGAMFGTLIDYWTMTGDTTYNAVTMQALLHQAGDDSDFMPLNQTRTEGNDDQGFWAMAALSAAENKFPDPPSDQPQWLALAQAVFNQYTTRWETAKCNGGLRWQIFSFNAGFDYKNSISNGCFFNVAARLARYTGNATYADWAVKIWDWQRGIGLVGDDYAVHDGSSIAGGSNCSGIDGTEWTYNSGIFLHGAAFMYNYTEDSVWLERTRGIVAKAQEKFFRDNVVYEQRCEDGNVCNVDQSSFKGYMLRWLSSARTVVPQLEPDIAPLIDASAAAAVRACAGSPARGFGGFPGTACGFKWAVDPPFDGTVGVGEQMNALSAVIYTLAAGAPGPVTVDTGGTSRGDVNAGSADKSRIGELAPITTGDRVGAGILTTFLLAGVIASGVFVVKE